MKRIAVAVSLLLVAALIGAFTLSRWPFAEAGRQTGRSPEAGAAARTGVPVETSAARLVRSTDDLRAIGSLQSEEAVKITAEVPGPIAEIRFKEGQPAQQNDVLVKLDDALAQAEVADAQARFTLAQANLNRANQLATTGSIAGRSRDEAVANFETARAAVELARVRLAKHTIRAPFAGIAGLRGISVGAFVNTGAEIVSLEKIDAVKVDFSVPEVFLSKVQVGQEVDVTVDALGQRSFKGRVSAIDPAIDVNGRALRVRAQLPNPDRALRPGLFARILIKGAEQQVVMVPETAVVPRGGDSFVFRIQNGRAIETKVELGLRKAGEVEIRNGLPADTVVVTAGHQRLRDGVPVVVVASGNSASG